MEAFFVASLRGRNDIDCGCQCLAVETFPEEDSPCLVCVIKSEVDEEEEEQHGEKQAHNINDPLVSFNEPLMGCP